MRITFHGAARSVTGSKHLIEVDGKRILLDCGMVQGKRNESREQNLTLPFDAKSIDVLILSHAHIDHSGNIPNLVKSGFRGDIISTYATRDLCASMLIDSASIQERDVQFVNKHHARRGECGPFSDCRRGRQASDAARLRGCRRPELCLRQGHEPYRQ